MSIDAFLHKIEAQLKTGQATEHTYRPALEALFNATLTPAVATNEPKQASYGAPDFIIQQGNAPIGHAEAKDVGLNLDRFIADSEREVPRTREGEQLKRYRAALPNLLYTDGLEWHWFVNGEPRLDAPVSLGTWSKSSKKLKPAAGAAEAITTLLTRFKGQQVQTVSTPRELAYRLALAARWLCDTIKLVFQDEKQTGPLHGQVQAFRDTLLPNLSHDDFADMYAQTIVYGLFAARVAEPDRPGFSRYDAARFIPKTNPFLRRLFQEIAGYELDDRIAWLVDDCAALLARTDMGAVLQDFGKATMQQDPVVHFYETFLASYDPKMREARGVYYTPEPVVGYIVRSVDLLLQQHFHKASGLADEQTVILDPATGTGTFLNAVVDSIYETLKGQGMASYWNSYVPDKLLPRLFGFELLMAPYTIAHMKLGLLLKDQGYQFERDERLGVYLTNALESLPPNQATLPFAHFIAEEGRQADDVKQHQPVMVVLGNPPYSYASENTGEWISELVRDYYYVDGKLLGERNPKGLQDDYVKFIRFGQWRISHTGEGVLAFISNNGYLDNPTFRGMRQSLLHDFDTIYLLNLHGNSRVKEQTPDGSHDENVFDIMQGVAIGIFVRRPEHQPGQVATVYYADLWGEREGKYTSLLEQDVSSTEWTQLSPTAPAYFIPCQVISGYSQPGDAS
jgi:predicted helicase